MSAVNEGLYGAILVSFGALTAGVDVYAWIGGFTVDRGVESVICNFNIYVEKVELIAGLEFNELHKFLFLKSNAASEWSDLYLVSFSVFFFFIMYNSAIVIGTNYFVLLNDNYITV